MKRWRLISMACVLLLAGCQLFLPSATSPDPTRPQVSVVGGRFIVVNAEPLVFLKDQRNVTITWQLPRGSNYRFPRDGIVVERKAEGEIVECGLRSDGLEFSCLNRHTKPGKYSYVIRVMEGSRRLESDPTIMNE